MNKGFTLIELILVISVGLAITFALFQQMLRINEDNQAKIIGEQIKQIGNSVNSYIAVHYDKLSSLQDSNGSTTRSLSKNMWNYYFYMSYHN